MKTARKQLLPVLLGITLVVTLLLGSGMNCHKVMAEQEEYYATWAAYKEAGNPAGTWNDVANAMDVVFNRAIENFEKGDYKAAYDGVNHGYYGYYETTGFERIAMGYISGARKTEVELQFSACKAVCKNEGTLDEFKEKIGVLSNMIRTDANILDGVSGESDSQQSDEGGQAAKAGGTSAAVATFTACFSIILREGFEAILIVGAILAYLSKSAEGDPKKQKKLLRPVYAGSILGILASFAMAWLLNQLKLANTASQEIIEGATALIAVCVLFYVSNWMLSKAETEAWTGYIKEKTTRSTENGNVWALAFTAFLSVFREGAEVVLFYQPTLASGHTSSVWAGFVVGCICLVFVYILIRFAGLRIPLKPFFTAISALMSFMAISFLGAGIKELIEGDVIALVSPEWLHWIPTNDFLDVLGIYPTLQTLVPQLILLVIMVVLFVIQSRKNKEIRLEAEARRAEEEALEALSKKKAEEEALEKKIREIVAKVLAEKA